LKIERFLRTLYRMSRAQYLLTAKPPPADLRLAYGPDPLQFGELRLPAGAGPHPVAIVVHGGFWRAAYDLRHIGHLATALTAAGVATWTIEYRRIGNPGGGWPGTFSDLAAAADHLRHLAPAHALDLRRVTAVGHSAGGHLALWLAARARIPTGHALSTPDPLPLQRAVGLAAVSDLQMCWELHLSNGVVEAFLGGAPDAVPERYAVASPAALLPLGVPQVLIHGTEDDSVPFAMSAVYHDTAVALHDPVTLIPLPGLEHFAVVDPESAAWPVVRDAVKRET
jgi:acetyl esterase/lipase